MRATVQLWRAAIGLLPLIAVGFGALAPFRAQAACDSGGIAWIRRLASPLDLSPGSAATPDGGLAISATFQKALLLDDGEAKPQELASASKGTGTVVLKLSAAGKLEWLRRVTGVDRLTSPIVKRDGTIVIGGAARGPIALEGKPGGTAVRSPGDATQFRLFLGFYAPDGTPRAIAIVAQPPPPTLAPTGTSAPFDLYAIAAAGDNVAVAGSFGNQVVLGAGPRRTTLVSRGGTDAFLAVLRGDGSLAWALRAGGEGSDSAGRLAVLGDGSIVVGGMFAARGPATRAGSEGEGATFGDGRSFVIRPEGLWDSFLARVAADGRVLWAQAVGGDERSKEKPIKGVEFWPHPERLAAIIAAPDGSILVSGVAPLPLRFGGDRTSLGTSGLLWQSYLARFSPDGKLRKAIALGGEVDATALLPGGDLLVVGSMDDELQYPTVGSKRVTLVSAGRGDALVARHGPDLDLRWATRLGSIGADRAWAGVADPAGAVTLTAGFERPFAVGADGCRPVRVPAEGRGSFFVRLEAGAALSDEARTRRLVDVKAKVKAARAAATRAFKAKNYVAACPLYQRVVAIAPDDPAAHADLGLCLQRLGRRDEAIVANRKAIALAAPTAGFDDDVAEATRRHAYYNLAKLDEKVKFPETPCGKLDAAPGCGKPLWVCTADQHDGGSGSQTTGTIARIAVSADHARIDKDEDVRPVMPSLGDWGPHQTEESWARNQNFANRADAIDVLLDQTTESNCHEGTGPDCGASDGTTDCSVVTANACLGLVATACTDTRDKKGKIKVDEFYLWPAK